MQYSSQLIEDAVQALSSLPGIGKKTALRLALYLVRQEESRVVQFSTAIRRMRQEIKMCRICHSLSDHEVCHICSNSSRNHSQVCVVENVRDLMAIEQTQHFHGVYHVLGGLISPIDGVGPEELQIASLLKRLQEQPVEELIFALSPTIEGETTMFYISRQLGNSRIRVSAIARGVAFGGELEYADELTLGRSIQARTPYSVNQPS